jgi:DNA processing protein
MTLRGAEQRRRAYFFMALSSIKGIGHTSLTQMARSNFDYESIFDSEKLTDVIGALRSFGARHVGDEQGSWSEIKGHALREADTYEKDFERSNMRLIFQDDPLFPTQLFDLPDPPLWLFVHGDIQSLNLPSIGVVGTRKPSPEGLWLSEYIGHCLRDWNVATVSGLALGIDQEIHKASLRANCPTIAFLGTGIFSDYPRGSERIRHEIVANGGAVVSEYLPRDTYSAANFVRRNRLQAALSKLLIPVEWKVKSGTAHTVGFALNMRRPMAMLRVQTQDGFGWLPPKVMGHSAQFTLPSQHSHFDNFVRTMIDRDIRPVEQLQLL